MNEKNEIVEVGKHKLLDIFMKEEDRKGTDILAMSNFFDVLIGKIDMGMNSETAWEVCLNVEGLLGQITAAIKGGFDISKMGMLVADYSHFSQDIIDGLKKGIYHVGKSKEVAGNMRPAILDEKGQLVKFFTLKKAINPAEVLADISTLSMQASLKQISSQIEEVGRDVKGMIAFERLKEFNNKFIYARERIMMASMADSGEQEEFLKEADKYLMEGLEALYIDINAQVEKLAKQKGPFAKLKDIDPLLSYINEDMQMIPRFVGLRVYLFNLRGKKDEAKYTLKGYQDKLKILTESKTADGKYTALELIHDNYPYHGENVDFWLERPRQMLEAIDSYTTMLAQEDKDIFYIEVEDADSE